jgi:hypothetical protein
MEPSGNRERLDVSMFFHGSSLEEPGFSEEVSMIWTNKTSPSLWTSSAPSTLWM